MLRPELAWFAKKMEEKLKENDYKNEWEDSIDLDYLFIRLVEEVGELAREIGNPYSPPEQTVEEAVDVANFAMFIADVMRKYYRLS